MPASIRNGQIEYLHKCANTYGFTIARHLINIRQSALVCSENMFTVFSGSHFNFHLNILVNMFIELLKYKYVTYPRCVHLLFSLFSRCAQLLYFLNRKEKRNNN